MNNIILIFLLLPVFSIAQVEIGRVNGASIIVEDDYYEVIFQNTKGKYDSFYISKGAVGIDGLANLSKYVKLLFYQQKGDYLLQFETDSVLLIYENGNVIMEIWRNHDSDNKLRSKGFTHEQFQELFGDFKYVKKKL